MRIRVLEELSSHVGGFLREWCNIDAAAVVTVQDAYEAWRIYCREHGIDQPGTDKVFSRDIHTAAGIESRQRRVSGEQKQCFVGLSLTDFAIGKVKQAAEIAACASKPQRGK
jgi:putative DNA primase/helicase